MDISIRTVQGLHRVEVRDRAGRVGTAAVELRYRRITVLPPIGKQKRYPPLSLTVLYARELETPKDRPAIDWRLITDLLVDSPEQAVEKLDWYARRWKIEVFHHILKTGCRAEHARLRAAVDQAFVPLDAPIAGAREVAIFPPVTGG